MAEIRSCRRCSITRVNLLCELHELAYAEGDQQAGNRLERLTTLAGVRGYKHAEQVLDPNLPKKTVRALCWNISSLLTDEDFTSLGLRVCKD